MCMLTFAPGRYLVFGTMGIRTRTTSSYLIRTLISHHLGKTVTATFTFFQGDQVVLRWIVPIPF